MAIGIPGIHSCGRRMVEFIRRLMIAEPVSTILGEPKFLGHGIPIESDGIPDTSRDNLIPAYVLIDTSAFTEVTSAKTEGIRGIRFATSRYRGMIECHRILFHGGGHENQRRDDNESCLLSSF